jgi:hypothetical protein
MKTVAILLICVAVAGASCNAKSKTPVAGDQPVRDGKTAQGLTGEGERPPTPSLEKPIDKNPPTVQNDAVVVEKENKMFVQIAFEHAKKTVEIKNPENAKVERKDGLVIVTFPYPYPVIPNRPHPPYPGPDFLARVTIERKSGKILEFRFEQ